MVKAERLSPNQKESSQVYAERRKAKHLHLENKITAIVMLFPVTCINFHSFALGILDYGKQNNLNPSVELTRYSKRHRDSELL